MAFVKQNMYKCYIYLMYICYVPGFYTLPKQSAHGILCKTIELGLHGYPSIHKLAHVWNHNDTVVHMCKEERGCLRKHV